MTQRYRPSHCNNRISTIIQLFSNSASAFLKNAAVVLHKKHSLFLVIRYTSRTFLTIFLLFHTFSQTATQATAPRLSYCMQKRRLADCCPARRLSTHLSVLLFHLGRMLPDFLDFLDACRQALLQALHILRRHIALQKQ